ncbi:hypothetical protein EXN32_21865 [Agrobacterium tumefaciens]|uniref:hypothetical protein n=1 Tax=Agrobacterium TaxID=357 RepID=UPI00115C8309|nr:MULTISPECIES: hypothetical protein [Agrobacterium]MDA5241125.1 hypothetical protein [Agrobacterium sp. MAFF310724]MDA5249584.1 hypothetical protein [Agrobacterium sp. MAFF210268]TRB12353.1 hypothetical protein EXN32_21865 [Agrobacterium tumefaciens]
MDALIATVNDPWALQPIGILIAGNAGWGGFPAPPTNKEYRYVMLTAGFAGAGQYNAGILIEESTTGSSPNITSTAKINMPASPMHGITVRLINTERRFLRPGAPGALQDSQNRSHTHHVNDPGHAHSVNLNPLKGPFNGANQDVGPGSGGSNWYNVGTSVNATGIWLSGDGGDEARPRSMGVDYYMRII